MMKQLLKQDVLFQFRHGFYYVYAFVTFVYILILLLIPLEYRGFWSTLIIFTDPGTLGFFFIGTIIMLERNQQLLQYLFITPIKLLPFLLSKMISLFIIAWITSVLIVYTALGMSVSLLHLTLGVLLCSLFFTAAGLAISVDSPSLNHFMFRAIVLMLLLYIPILNYIGWLPWKFLEVMPSYSALYLLDGAMSGGNGLLSFPAGGTTIIVHTGLLALWGAVGFYIAYIRFNRYILSNTGEHKEISV
ncbi:fluoroquinolone transport system permease protein [Evansella caseinilytica]|uniref:Fluoroquinolone transport system permease protein n=1 Tax=Evansella caseinilytica TaxID=1503961 RepID=A0A1H3QST3_9BACI|nr:hypothetical protein [Evansella caseinilytica]SDZ16487.1 fluoroquinolone transport system permease protein [Evansella caseinilytica]